MSERLPGEAELNLRFAWAVLMLGYNQHDVASLFGVNSARISEAVRAVRMAIRDPIFFSEMPEKDETQKEQS